MPVLTKHTRHVSKRDNLNHKAVYNTDTWRKLRLLYLSENPLCERCKKAGRLRSGIDVHHRVPVSSAKGLQAKRTLGLNYDNLETLCRDCHKEEHGRKDFKKQGRTVFIKNYKKDPFEGH